MCLVREAIAEWAADNPKIRRAWLSAAGDVQWTDSVVVELQPVADSEETLAVWIANCDRWHSQLQARIGAAVDVGWFDPDGAASTIHAAMQEAGILVYELK